MIRGLGLFLLGFGALAGLILDGPGARAARAARACPPSVLVLRADQLRASALGCYGDPHGATPRLDLLAAESTVYSRCLSSEPVCSPHRVAFAVGKYTHATSNGDKLHPQDRTTHDLLQAEGYRCWHVGKWHMTPPNLQMPQFAEVVPAAILGGLDYHAGHEDKHDLVDAEYWENGSIAAKKAGPWRPQKYVDLAKAQLDLAAQSGQPFYGVVDLEPPHTPYDDISGTPWDVYQPGDIPAPPNVPAADVAAAEAQLADYYSMVLSVDEMFGQILDHLDLVGLSASTVVIVTSDHGAHVGSHGYLSVSNQKRTPHAEAIRVPLIVRAPGQRAATTDELFDVVDFKPLICGLAGVELPGSLHGFKHPAGARLLAGFDSANTPDGAWVGVYREDGMVYARSENSGAWLMFDTAADPWELSNLVGTADPREPEMQALLEEAAAKVGYVIQW